MHIFDFFRDIFSVFGAFSRFLGVKFGFRKSCLCKRNDKYEVCIEGATQGGIESISIPTCPRRSADLTQAQGSFQAGRWHPRKPFSTPPSSAASRSVAPPQM